VCPAAIQGKLLKSFEDSCNIKEDVATLKLKIDTERVVDLVIPLSG
jgi:hypothetical protein